MEPTHDEQLATLLNQERPPLEPSLDLIHAVLSDDEGEPPPITLTSSTSLITKLNKEHLQFSNKNILLTLTKCLTFYCKLPPPHTRGALEIASLLRKGIKVTPASVEMVEIVCDELEPVIAQKLVKKTQFYLTVLDTMLIMKSNEPPEVGMEKLFMGRVVPLLRRLDDKSKEAFSSLRNIPFAWLMKGGLEDIALKRSDAPQRVIESIESGQLPADDKSIFKQLCSRVAELSPEDFDPFISFLFDKLMQWEGNFQVLGVLVDLFDVVLRISNAAVRSELECALRSIDLWHVKMLVCWELFGEPPLESMTQTSSPSSIPLELYAHYKSSTHPPDALIKRIYSLTDDQTYKFCLLALEHVFGIETLTNVESEVQNVSRKVSAMICKYGKDVVPRLRHVLSSDFRHAAQ